MSDRAYPLPMPGPGDYRFTFGLADGVSQVLVDHGFPPVRGAMDRTRLMAALKRFIYDDAPVALSQTSARPVEPALIHALMPDGAETPRCGAAGRSRIGMFAFSVTCPKCRQLLEEQIASETGTGDFGYETGIACSESTSTEPPGDAP